MTSTDTINVTDLVKTLHYCERYNEGYAPLQAIRVQVDEALYAFYRERLTLLNKQSNAVLPVRYAAGDKRIGHGRNEHWSLTYTEAFDKARDLAETDGYAATRAREALAAHAKVTVGYATTSRPRSRWSTRTTHGHGHAPSSSLTATCTAAWRAAHASRLPSSHG